MKGSRCLLVGCGDIGIKLAEALLAEGARVWGLRRDCGSLPAGIAPLAADVRDAASLEGLRGMPFDFVVVTLTPDAFTAADYSRVYVEGLSNLLAVLDTRSLQRLLYVSSTSVYHQDDGSWVDESSPTRPRGFSGQQLLQAEQLLAASALPATVIRFAGIYGPGRERLLAQVRRGEGCPEQPVLYTNRIHRDDCVGFLAHLLRLQCQGEYLQPCYLGVDSEPVSLWELKTWLAQQLGITGSQWRELAVTRRNSKRCSNKRMLASAYQLQYPGYRQGYSTLLQQQAPKPLL